MRTRAISTALCLLAAAGCNAIFGVEEPILVSSGEGGAAGADGTGGRPAHSGGPSSPDAGSGGELALAGGGAGNAEPAENAGNAGDGGRPASSGGTASAGVPHENGGEPQLVGGSPSAGGSANQGGTETGGSPSTTGGSGGSTDCLPSQRECEDDEYERTCANGTWKSSQCAFGCVVDRCAECEAGDVQCNAATTRARACNTQTGRWDAFVDCVNQTCFAGIGCDGECAPGQERCNPETGDADSCDDDTGTWTQIAECTAQTQICVLESGSAECLPNSLRPLGPDQIFGNGAPEAVTPHVLRFFALPEVDEVVQVIELGLIAEGNSRSYARMSIYEDDGSGKPGALVIDELGLTIDFEQDRQTVPVPSGVLLQPDERYWLAVVFRETGSPEVWGRSATSASSYQLAHDYADAFPTTFPSASAVEVLGTEWNLFLMVRTRTPD